MGMRLMAGVVATTRTAQRTHKNDATADKNDTQNITTNGVSARRPFFFRRRCSWGLGGEAARNIHTVGTCRGRVQTRPDGVGIDR